jgi:hypothetical protein
MNANNRSIKGINSVQNEWFLDIILWCYTNNVWGKKLLLFVQWIVTLILESHWTKNPAVENMSMLGYKT